MLRERKEDVVEPTFACELGPEQAVLLLENWDYHRSTEEVKAASIWPTRDTLHSGCVKRDVSMFASLNKFIWIRPTKMIQVIRHEGMAVHRAGIRAADPENTFTANLPEEMYRRIRRGAEE